MPNIDNTRMFAMYVIGEVESGWDWTGVYRADPITLGMLQNYGLRARNLLALCAENDAEGYAAFTAAAPQLAANVDAHPDDYYWWTSRYVTDTEANAWQTMAARDANHVVQQQLWFDDFQGYADLLTTWGLSLDRPQTMVYAMAMYHQSPRQAGMVIASCSGVATLDNMHATCLNDSVLGRYTNRYNTVFSRLSVWDGESAPPDFGQVTEDTSVGGNPEGITRPDSPVSRVELNHGMIFVYGIAGYEGGLACTLAGPNLWIPAKQVAGVPDQGGTTGGGDNKQGSAIIEYLRSVEGQWWYSNDPSRLDPENSKVTDCSGTVWWAYHHIAGIDLGTWTGTQSADGVEVWRGYSAAEMPWQDMRAGDLILMTGDASLLWGFAGYWCHIELYTGDGTNIIGSPSNAVPTEKEGIAWINGYQPAGIMVRRIEELDARFL